MTTKLQADQVNSLLSYIAETVTTGNVTAVSGKHYDCTIAGMTAERDFNLPTPSAVGEKVSLRILDGDATYELVVKANSVEITRLFIAGETLEFMSYGTGAGDWKILVDGRIPVKCHIYDDNGTTWNTGTSTTPNYSSTLTNVGDCADLTNDRIKIRRGGLYSVTMTAISANDIAAAGPYLGWILGTTSIGAPISARRAILTSGGRAVFDGAYDVTLTTSDVYLQIQFRQDSGENTSFYTSNLSAAVIMTEIL